MDCIFCKILNGELPSKKAYEDDRIYAFHDIKPQAKTHIIIIPKVGKAAGVVHLDNVDEISETNSHIIAHIFERISLIAADNGLTNGYRVVTNCGEDGAQTVNHLHFHLLGGERLPEKIGKDI